MGTCGAPDCARPGTLRCARCRVTRYCSKAHQKRDWKRHKAACAALAQGADPDCVAAGTFTGTFRWAPGKRFLELPAERPPAPADVSGWGPFFRWRGGQQLSRAVQADPAACDALSMPLSLMFAQAQMGLPVPADGTLHALLLGVSQHAEQRVCLETDYWAELLGTEGVDAVRLYFVGPQLAAHEPVTRHEGRFEASFFVGTCGEYLDGPGRGRDRRHDRVIGFNPGFGNWTDSGRFDLTWSWLPDLRRLAALDAPVVFTQANDYADLRGELAVLTAVVGAPMRLRPQENPFSAASHHEDPSAPRQPAWSRANSYIYAFQGLLESPGESRDVLALMKAAARDEPMGYMMWSPPSAPPCAGSSSASAGSSSAGSSSAGSSADEVAAVAAEVAEDQVAEMVAAEAAEAVAALAAEVAAEAAAQQEAAASQQEAAQPQQEAADQPQQEAADQTISFHVDVAEMPAAMTVNVHLPGVASAGDVDLDVAPERVRVTVRGDGREAELDLPRAVDVGSVSAKWRRRKQVLRVRMQTA